MQNELKGRKVAILVAEGCEEQELTGPRQALNEAGAQTSLISPAEGRVQTIPEAVRFVKHFFEAGKPVAAICHGPWMLIEAGVVRGRTLTSWPSVQTDIRNAGGNWVDQEVVTDHGLVTSRKPSDIPAFNRKMIEDFAEGSHRRGQERKIA